MNARPILETGDEIGSGLLVARRQGIYPQDLRLTPCRVSLAVQHKQEFEAGGLQWSAWRVRGHSEDSVCYVTDFEGSRWLFSGDAVFYGGVLGVINADGSSMTGYREDLPTLRNLNIDGLFPGHGLFTLRDGQRHIDMAIEQLVKGFLPRQIGQGDLIF
jgi:glyoxylase-like metal-dependent hydrolase (beta-lactamase superfamily II)